MSRIVLLQRSGGPTTLIEKGKGNVKMSRSKGGISRRKFLGYSGTAWAMQRTLEGTLTSIVAHTLTSKAQASEPQTQGGQSVVFCAFDGGAPLQVGSFDPKESLHRPGSDGSPLFITSPSGGSAPILFPVRTEASEYVVQEQLKYRSPLAPVVRPARRSPHADLQRDWRYDSASRQFRERWRGHEDLYSPAVYSHPLTPQLELGPIALPLLKHSPYMTVLKGVDLTFQHPTAGASNWTGSTSISERRPVIDCLLATALGQGAILPHLGFLYDGVRNTFANQDFPSSGAPLRIPSSVLQNSPNPTQASAAFAQAYKTFFQEQFSSRLSPQSSDRLSGRFSHSLDQWTQLIFQSQIEKSKSPENRELWSSMFELFRSRKEVSQGAFIDALHSDTVSFFQEVVDELNAQGFGSLLGPRDYNDPFSTTTSYFVSREVWWSWISQAGAIASLVGQGITRVATLSFRGWDWHTENVVLQPHWRTLQAIFLIVSKMIDRINTYRKDPEMKRTTVAFMPELSREPFCNPNTRSEADGAGQEHWNTQSLTLIGGPLGLGNSFGGTDPHYQQLKIDPVTGNALPANHHSGIYLTPVYLLAALAKHVGGMSDETIRSTYGLSPSELLGFLKPNLGAKH
jgi:hypothetical protein